MLTVSVCIPTRNTGRYLPQAIESVLAQDFTDYELVICDNASTDGTLELCRQYARPNVRYLYFKEPTNQAGNFNRCLQEARGDYITLLHADDYFFPGFLADRADRLNRQKEVGFVFGAVQVVAADGKLISENRRWAEDRFFPAEELLEVLLQGCVVCPPSVMVRRECIEKVGPFRTDLTWGHDWEWMMRLAQQAAVGYASEPLAAYRVHDMSGTAEVLSAAKNGQQELLILQETLERLSQINPRFRRQRKPAFQAMGSRHMFFAEQALLDGKTQVARYNLRFAARTDPRMLFRPTFWAILISSLGSPLWYTHYRSLRHPRPSSEMSS